MLSSDLVSLEPVADAHCPVAWPDPTVRANAEPVDVVLNQAVRIRGVLLDERPHLRYRLPPRIVMPRQARLHEWESMVLNQPVPEVNWVIDTPPPGIVLRQLGTQRQRI